MGLPSRNGRARYQEAALAVVFAACVWLLPGAVAAEALPTSGDFHLQRTAEQLLGREGAAAYAGIFRADERLSWEVYLPDNESDGLPGAIVYVSPHESGRVDTGWREVFDRHNFIYIAANGSGNEVAVKKRMALAVLALKALEQQRAVAADRVFVAGFSGGGRVASMLATNFPSLFRGGLYICGVDFWKREFVPDAQRMAENRFVFLTGTRDFNRDETRSVHRKYLKAGARNSKLIVVSGMKHDTPGAQDLDEALRFLDERP